MDGPPSSLGIESGKKREGASSNRIGRSVAEHSQGHTVSESHRWRLTLG